MRSLTGSKNPPQGSRFSRRIFLSRSLPTFFATALFAVAAQAAPLAPASISAGVSRSFDALHTAADVSAQQALESSIAALGLQRAVAEGHLAVALVDITDVAHPKLAQVNGNQMLYAASLPKIAILLGAFQAIEDGRLTLDAALMDEMKRMIRQSSNLAATNVMNRVGAEYLAGVLQSDRYRLYDTSHNGGLWVGKPYGVGSSYKRDPLHNLSHGATAYQVARFYYLLETGALVSPEASRKMKEIMGSPAIHHKFVGGLEKYQPDAQMFRKSGTWRNFHADSAIVEHHGRRYIAVGLADDPRGGDWMRDLIVAMDDIVFERHRAPATTTLAATPAVIEAETTTATISTVGVSQ